MNIKKTIGYVLLAVLVVWIGYGIAGQSKKSDGGTIKLGAIISMTGFAADFGEMSKKGIDLAVSEINAKGGIDGRLVEVIIEDDRTDAKTAAGLYQKLTSIDHVDGIIGSNFDFTTQPIFALAKTGTTAVISPSNPRIAGSFDTNEHSFVMMSDFDKMIRAFDGFLKTETHQKLGILRFDSAFSAEIAETLSELEIATGKQAIFEETYKEIGSNDFRTVILKLKKEKVDLLFLDMIGQDTLTFLTQARQLGYMPKLFTYTEALATMHTVKGVDKSLYEGIVVVNWDVATEAFSKVFEARYQTKPVKSAHRAYEAVYLLAEAVAAVNDSSKVSGYLEAHAFTTPNGPFSFTKEHAAAQTPVTIEVVKGGAFEAYRR